MRLIDADKVRKKLVYFICSTGIDELPYEFASDIIDKEPTVKAIPVDYIWDRAEFYEKQWLEDDNHWAKNVAEALRALLEDWDGEVGDILDKYE